MLFRTVLNHAFAALFAQLKECVPTLVKSLVVVLRYLSFFYPWIVNIITAIDKLAFLPSLPHVPLSEFTKRLKLSLPRCYGRRLSCERRQRNALPSFQLVFIRICRVAAWSRWKLSRTSLRWTVMTSSTVDRSTAMTGKTV